MTQILTCQLDQFKGEAGQTDLPAHPPFYTVPFPHARFVSVLFRYAIPIFEHPLSFRLLSDPPTFFPNQMIMSHLQEMVEALPYGLSIATAEGAMEIVTETILLAEDAILVREIVRIFLQEEGYNVLEAANGAEALQLAKKTKKTIHLLLTDVVMPEMSGPGMALRLAADRKGIKVLYMSGYFTHPLVQEIVLKAGASFIAKPFAPSALLQKVREVLDSPKIKSQQLGIPLEAGRRRHHIQEQTGPHRPENRLLRWKK